MIKEGVLDPMPLAEMQAEHLLNAVIRLLRLPHTENAKYPPFKGTLVTTGVALCRV
jgi:hypothetical protein